MEAQVVNSDEPPPCEQIETCLANLFDVPTKNIECAFQLILGLLKSQSSEIDSLKCAHDEALKCNDKIRTSMQNDIDKLAREKDELSQHFQNLNNEHTHLRTSYDTTLNTVDELKNELEVRVVACHHTSILSFSAVVGSYPTCIVSVCNKDSYI